LGRVGVLTLL